MKKIKTTHSYFLAGIITLSFFAIIGKVTIFKNQKTNLVDLNNFFFYLMLILFLFYLIFRLFSDKKRLESIDNFYTKISNTEKILIRSKLLDLINDIHNLDYTPEITELWAGFVSSIIDVEKEENGLQIKEVYQTIDSEYFFNSDTLLREKMNFKLLNYIPQGLVGLGLLGTFLGLALGLESLNLDTQEAMNNSIKTLISGVKISFYTSLYGMYFSISFSFIINMYIGEYEKKIIKIKDRLNNLFDKNISDKTILNIKYQVGKVLIATNDMATNLTNELQHGLGEIKKSNETLITELGETINSQMGGISTGLNESFAKNIGESLEKIFSSDFVEKFENIKNELIEVSQKNNVFISEYKNEIKEIAYKTAELTEIYVNTSDKIIIGFENFNEEIENSFKSLDVMYNKSLESYERIDNIFEKSKQQMLELDSFMKKSGTIANSLDNFIDAEKEIVELWQGYKGSFESLNNTINTGIKNYEENIRITSNKYENILKENFEQYKQIIEQSGNDYTERVKDGVSSLFSEYDTQLSEVVNKFSSIVSLFSEKLDDSNQIFNSHREMFDINMKQLDDFKNTIKFQNKNKNEN